MPTDTPVPPFSATVDGVLALTPEATLFDGAVPAGRRGVTVEQVTAWLGELSARVARRLDGWERLDTEPDDPETTSDREQLVTSARDLVHNGAASYLEAARHPEQQGKATTSYADVLWARFTEGLDELAGWLAKRLAASGTDPDTGEPTGTGGLAYHFPEPSFTPALGF